MKALAPPYRVQPLFQSEQAEGNPLNPIAGNTQIRILIELQVQTMLLHQAVNSTEDLVDMRNSIAATMLPYQTVNT